MCCSRRIDDYGLGSKYDRIKLANIIEQFSSLLRGLDAGDSAL